MMMNLPIQFSSKLVRPDREYVPSQPPPLTNFLLLSRPGNILGMVLVGGRGDDKQKRALPKPEIEGTE